MQGQYNLRSPAVKRLMREAQELREPTEQYFAQPLEDNLFEWHFTIRGPAETEFESGIYHGRIVLPPEYPMKPPSIILLTANGRFETHKKICLSISGHHPESWQPSWSIRTALLAIIGFMPTHGNGAIGSLDYTPEERKKLAKKSLEWKCPECGSVRLCLQEVTEASKALSKEAKELGAQINMQGEKEKVSAPDSPKESESESKSGVNSPTAAAEAGANPSAPYPGMPSFPGFSPQMLQMMRAQFANSPVGIPPMGMNPFMANMGNQGTVPQAGPGGTVNRPQGMPNLPFWPPNFGAMPGGSAMPRFPSWPPGANFPTYTSTTDSVQTTKTNLMPSSNSNQSAAPITTTTNVSSSVNSYPGSSTGARPKTSSSVAASFPVPASTSTSPSSAAHATPESTSPQSSTSSGTAPTCEAASSMSSPPTSTPASTSTTASSEVRQRNVGPARPQVTIAGVRQPAELPRRQQSEGFTFSLCLLTLLGIALAILMIRRLIMMDILRFYDTIE